MTRVLKRHKSTIFREIRRNFWTEDALPKKYAGYFGHAAQLQTNKRRSVQRKLNRQPKLCKTVVAKIKLSRLPRKRDITALTDHDMKMISECLNNTPRKCLGWQTPAEVFRDKMMEEMDNAPYLKGNRRRGSAIAHTALFFGDRSPL